MADPHKVIASAGERPADHNKYPDIDPNRSNDGNSGSPPTEIEPGKIPGVDHDIAPKNIPEIEPGKIPETGPSTGN